MLKKKCFVNFVRISYFIISPSPFLAGKTFIAVDCSFLFKPKAVKFWEANFTNSSNGITESKLMLITNIIISSKVNYI